MSTSTMTITEAVNSLTGFDEIAVEKLFGIDLEALQEKSTKLMRALAVVHYRRAGMSDPDAYTAGLALTLGELGEFFEADPDDLDPDDPDTAAGKDSAPHGEPPTGSPTGASPPGNPRPSTTS